MFILQKCVWRAWKLQDFWSRWNFRKFKNFKPSRWYSTRNSRAIVLYVSSFRTEVSQYTNFHSRLLKIVSKLKILSKRKILLSDLIFTVLTLIYDPQYKFYNGQRTECKFIMLLGLLKKQPAVGPFTRWYKGPKQMFIIWWNHYVITNQHIETNIIFLLNHF